MKIGIAIIHGIGRQDKSYANEFIREIKKHYRKYSDNVNLVFESICWQEDIEPIEHDLFNKMGKLGWKLLRSFFIGYGGDALCYQPSSVASSGFYVKVHKSIDEGLARLYDALDPESPLCIISHSLGTVVTSNFIWDSQNGSKIYNPSEKSKNLISRLELLYTMGSPLAVWSMRYDDGGVPITVNDVCRWYNFYCHTDIISSPLKSINQHYLCMSNLFDVKVKVGGLLFSWNPLSHNNYWDSSFVTKHIACNLNKLDTFYTNMEDYNAKS